MSYFILLSISCRNFSFLLRTWRTSSVIFPHFCCCLVIRRRKKSFVESDRRKKFRIFSHFVCTNRNRRKKLKKYRTEMKIYFHIHIWIGKKKHVNAHFDMCQFSNENWKGKKEENFMKIINNGKRSSVLMMEIFSQQWEQRGFRKINI